jgi:hypothetical protein
MTNLSCSPLVVVIRTMSRFVDGKKANLMPTSRDHSDRKSCGLKCSGCQSFMEEPRSVLDLTKFVTDLTKSTTDQGYSMPAQLAHLQAIALDARKQTFFRHQRTFVDHGQALVGDEPVSIVRRSWFFEARRDKRREQFCRESVKSLPVRNGWD